jgi:hypothetical protein
MNVSPMAIIQTLVLPPLSLFLAYGIGWMLRLWWPRFGRVVSGAAIVLLFVLCTNAGAWLLLRPLESLEPEYGGRDIPDYVALARARYAAKLQRETGLPLLVSGGRRTDGPDESLANGMARALQEDFATPVRWVEDNSANTAENAAFSAQILKHAGMRRILLVTDAMHMRRARVAFAREGLEVIGAPTMFFSRDRWSLLDFLPGAEGLRRSRYAMYEWLGMAWYGLQYALVRTAEADIH